jgi:Fe-S-cluster containining protein
LCRDDGDRAKADACCQHGADVMLPEKAAILRRSAEVASVLEPKWRDPARWFDERDPGVEDEPPFGTIIRTATTDLDVDDSGCVFLEHTGKRGCGLHAAALQHGFDPAEIKPSVCRLYPLSLEGGRLGLSEDFDRYSCANSGSSSLYSVMRSVLADMFGEALVRALDEVDARVRVRRLRSLG